MKIRSRIACLMIICSVVELGYGAVFTVGDASGWSMTADYGTWASGKTFSVGDTLVFNYPPGHTVDEVSATDYKTCTIGNAMASDSSGATTVLLKTASPHYYICGVPGHCGGGMKLSINVVAAATGTTTSPAPPTGVTTLAPPTGVAILPPPSGFAVPTGYIDPYSSSARLSPAAAVVLGFYVVVVTVFFV